MPQAPTPPALPYKGAHQAPGVKPSPCEGLLPEAHGAHDANANFPESISDGLDWLPPEPRHTQPDPCTCEHDRSKRVPAQRPENATSHNAAFHIGSILCLVTEESSLMYSLSSNNEIMNKISFGFAY